MAEGPRVWAATRVGLVRTANEDGWRVGGIAGDAPDGNWSGSLPSTRPWVLVADGMGGHGSGDVASSVALDALCRHFDRDGASDMRSAIAEANWAVFSAMDEAPGRRAMGTTVAGFRRRATSFLRFDLDAHLAGGPGDHLDGAFHITRIQVRHLASRDLLDLLFRQATDLLLVRLLAACGDIQRLLD